MELSDLLLNWYRPDARDLPWRGTRDVYKIWLSEIMLQQTQAATVRAYYARFLDMFPTVDDLAAADTDTVLKLWEGLGYYSRARNLHAAAKLVCAAGVAFPDSVEGLEQFAGVVGDCLSSEVGQVVVVVGAAKLRLGGEQLEGCLAHVLQVVEYLGAAPARH